MTEQMAIEHIGNLAGDYKCWDDRISREESLILCKLLDELEQYRALGTVEEILKEFNIQRDIIATQHETLKEYRNLGTVEELRVARDKQVAKKPIPKYGMYNTINRYKCPTCDNDYLGGGEYRYPCCEDCGQKLDWSDESGS